MRIITPRHQPDHILQQQLRAMTSAVHIAEMVAEIHLHGAGRWKIKEITDRIATSEKAAGFTHCIEIVYRPTNRPGVWGMYFGLHRDGRIGLWMD